MFLSLSLLLSHVVLRKKNIEDVNFMRKRGKHIFALGFDELCYGD
jgi:hypothetical protein